jgi:putative spermidine/putrescine transport system permease protein
MNRLAAVQTRFTIRNCAIVSVAFVGVAPIVLLVVWSFARAWYWPRLLPLEWSLRAWQYALSPSTEIFNALLMSAQLGLTVALLALIVALPAGRALGLHDFRGKRLALYALLAPVLSSPLASIMGMHTLFIRYGLTDTVFGVALAHLAFAVPYTTLTLAGSFSRLDPDLEAQARTLGASRWRVWRYVTLPAIMPGLAISSGFAFLISLNQYLTTTLIGGGQVITLPLLLVSFERSGDEAVTAALTLLFMSCAFIPLGIAARLMSRYDRKG